MVAASNHLESDNGYDVRARHPERDAYYREFADQSERVRRNCHARLDIPYGRGKRERLDIFPAGNASPVAIFIHGGFWQAHDKSEFSFVASPLVEAGITAIVINYDRAPACSLPDLIFQVQKCCEWVHRNAGDLGVDAERIYVTGHSAGAHLAGAVVNTNWSEKGLPAGLVKGACLISGIFDLAPLGGTQIGDSVGLDEATASQASPLLMVRPSSATLIVAAGGNESDAFISQSEAMAHAWKEAGNAGELQILQGLNHYDMVLALGDGESDPMRAFVDIIGFNPSGSRPKRGKF